MREDPEGHRGGEVHVPHRACKQLRYGANRTLPGSKPESSRTLARLRSEGALPIIERALRASVRLAPSLSPPGEAAGGSIGDSQSPFDRQSPME